MDYREAVLTAFEAGKSDTPMAVAFADAIMAAYAAGRAVPDDSQPVQNWRVGEATDLGSDDRIVSKHEFEAFMTWRGKLLRGSDELEADHKRMNYIRRNAVRTNTGIYLDGSLFPTDKNLDEWLDAEIKESEL